MKIQDFLDSIDTSKVENYSDIYGMCQHEFDIYGWIEQGGNPRLISCYYDTWVCTDSQVGLRVWYLDNEPVCISFMPYRKSTESFQWISKDLFLKVEGYLNSLVSKDFDINIVDEGVLEIMLEKCNNIDHKPHREQYLKLVE